VFTVGQEPIIVRVFAPSVAIDDLDHSVLLDRQLRGDRRRRSTGEVANDATRCRKKRTNGLLLLILDQLPFSKKRLLMVHGLQFREMLPRY
jgi:hypothetical protein